MIFKNINIVLTCYCHNIMMWPFSLRDLCWLFNTVLMKWHILLPFVFPAYINKGRSDLFGYGYRWGLLRGKTLQLHYFTLYYYTLKSLGLKQYFCFKIWKYCQWPVHLEVYTTHLIVKFLHYLHYYSSNCTFNCNITDKNPLRLA